MKKQNRWECLLQAAVIASNISRGSLLAVIKHDGSKILWPELAEPKCRQGFSVQEIIDALVQHGFRPLHVMMNPRIAPTESALDYAVYTDTEVASRVEAYTLIFQTAIIILRGHAIAKVGTQYFDPDTGLACSKPYWRHIEGILGVKYV